MRSIGRIAVLSCAGKLIWPCWHALHLIVPTSPRLGMWDYKWNRLYFFLLLFCIVCVVILFFFFFLGWWWYFFLLLKSVWWDISFCCHAVSSLQQDLLITFSHPSVSSVWIHTYLFEGGLLKLKAVSLLKIRREIQFLGRYPLYSIFLFPFCTACVMGYCFCCPFEPFLWYFCDMHFCIICMVVYFFLLPFLLFEQARVFSASLHHSFNHLFSYRQEHFPPELGWPHATPQRREDVALRCLWQDLCQKRWASAPWLYPQPAVAFLLWDLWHVLRIMTSVYLQSEMALLLWDL